MRLGKAAMEALQAEVTGRLAPGDEILVAGAIALEGTSLISESEKEKLGKLFSPGFLYNCQSLLKDYGVGGCEGDAWKAAEEAGASALFALKEGGFLSGLWKMAEASSVGLEADLRKVPIRQETIEVCEIFDINPYRLLSGGAILIGIRGGEALVQELRRKGFMAEIIGQANSGNDRLLYSGGNARYLERPTADEIRKIQK
ncbi:MAG: AIR synthase-related protein [Blautia sp.]|nr:AIR synthase-related protein [Blautia sp.]